MNLNYGGLFRDWEIAVAKKLVEEYRRRWKCLCREDFEDLLQEVLTHWYFAKDEYDHKREASQTTFMGKVIRNKLNDFVRERETDKRKIAHLTISLDKSLEDDENAPTLMDRIDKTTASDAATDHLLEVELKIDLSKALRKLSAKQKELCHLIGEKGLSIKETSECLGTPRSTIYDELERIRKIFSKEGLEDYLK
ncbi:sigma-70 family RNA polymerase sigma factor [Candidatus Poribacteria bacterium]